MDVKTSNKVTLHENLERTEGILNEINKQMDIMHSKLHGPNPQCECSDKCLKSMLGLLEQSDYNLTLAERLAKELYILVDSL